MCLIRKLIKDYKEYAKSLLEKPELILEPGYKQIRDFVTVGKKGLFYQKCKMIVKGSPYKENNILLRELPLNHQGISFVRYQDKKCVGLYDYYVVCMYGKAIGVVREKKFSFSFDVNRVGSIYAYYKKTEFT